MNKIKKEKTRLKCLGRFRSLGSLGVCRKHGKCIHLRACKIWCKSVRKYLVRDPKLIQLLFLLLVGLSASRAHAEGRNSPAFIISHISCLLTHNLLLSYLVSYIIIGGEFEGEGCCVHNQIGLNWALGSYAILTYYTYPIYCLCSQFWSTKSYLWSK